MIVSLGAVWWLGRRNKKKAISAGRTRNQTEANLMFITEIFKSVQGEGRARFAVRVCAPNGFAICVVRGATRRMRSTRKENERG